MPPACVANLEPSSVLPLVKFIQSKMNRPCPAIHARTGYVQTSLKEKERTFPVYVCADSPMCRNQMLKTYLSANSSCNATKDFKVTHWCLFLHNCIYFFISEKILLKTPVGNLLVPSDCGDRWLSLNRGRICCRFVVMNLPLWMHFFTRMPQHPDMSVEGRLCKH